MSTTPKKDADTDAKAPRRRASIRITLDERIAEMLLQLTQTGLFPATVEQCAEELLRAKLRELEREEWCGASTMARDRRRLA